jgi:hypothetical protein
MQKPWGYRSMSCNNAPYSTDAGVVVSTVDFSHQQSAHCESGAISSLLRHSGLPLSEPMALGISGAMTYAYIPLIKLSGLPLIAYRMPPGHIIRGVTRRLGIKMHVERFRDPESGMTALSRYLSQGRPVGLQTSVYWLPYFPEDLRFHFNAHNLVVYGEENNEFLISDPTFEQPVRADYAALQKSRFVRGMAAPKGLLYFPERVPEAPDMATAIRKAVRFNTRVMLSSPLPVVGIKGIEFMGRKLEKFSRGSTQSQQDNLRFIGHIVRMQEEIGTGGAGFRFVYASFLQEAAELLDNAALEEVSGRFTHAGDEWRRFALHAAKMCKGRMDLDYAGLGAQLKVIAQLESEAYRQLRAAIS